jgi:hypothetical protein
LLGVASNPSAIILIKNYSLGMAHSLTWLEKIKPPFKNGGLPKVPVISANAFWLLKAQTQKGLVEISGVGGFILSDELWLQMPILHQHAISYAIL